MTPFGFVLGVPVQDAEARSNNLIVAPDTGVAITMRRSVPPVALTAVVAAAVMTTDEDAGRCVNHAVVFGVLPGCTVHVPLCTALTLFPFVLRSAYAIAKASSKRQAAMTCFIGTPKRLRLRPCPKRST